MATPDGSIVISTKIDEKGFNKGTQGLSKALSGVLNIVKSIGKFMAAAFIGGSVINSLRGITQSFDIMGSAVGDKIRPLTDALATLKGTFVNLIVQAIIPLIPYLVTAVEWFTRMLTTVIQVVAALFGFKTTVGNIMTTAAKGAQKAAKEAKGALAAFDQINVLQKTEDPTDPDAATGPTSTPAPITVPQELLDKVEALKKKLMDFLQPAIELFEKLKKIVIETWEKLTTWIKENPEKFRTFLIILGLLVLAFIAVAAIIWLVTAAMTVATAVTSVFTVVMALLASPIFLIVVIIGLLIAILVILALNWDTIKILAVATWEAIKKAWGMAVEWFKTKVIDPFVENFTRGLDFIKDKWISVFTNIKNFIKDTINSILGYISEMIDSILAGIAAITGIGEVEVGAGTTSGSFRIPHLANGAVIPPNARFAAILGDQTSGRNIEAPEGLIRQIMREEMSNQQQGISVRFEGSLGELVRQLKPVIERENTRTGGNLIRGTNK